MSCNDPQDYNIKEYDSVSILCRYKDDNGLPLSLDGIEIRSELRSAMGALIDNLSVRVSDSAQGEFVLTPTVDKLPIGKHKIDVVFTSLGKRISSDTFHIVVGRAVTEV